MSTGESSAPSPLKRLFDFCPWRFAKEADEAARRAQRAHQAQLETLGARLGQDCFVSPLAGVYPDALTLGDRSYIAAYAYVTDQVETGADCTLNPYAVVRGRVRLGAGVRVGAHASILGFNHEYRDPGTPVFQQGITSAGVEVGDDVWIGSGALVLDGVRVGSHSIVAAGAVVTKNVPEYAIVGGNPARVLRSRLASGTSVRGAPPESRLSDFGRRVHHEWRGVLARCAEETGHGLHYVQQPGHSPSVRAWCDAVEIAAMFGETPPLEERAALVARLQAFQDPETGLLPDPWSPPQPGHDPWRLSDHLSRYHLLAV